MMSNLYALYSSQRLRWYGLASGQAVLRHWQWLLVAGLVVPGIPVIPLLDALSQVLIAIVSPGLGWPLRLAALAGIEVAAMLWIAPQRHVVGGGDLASYAATLPISGLARRLVDLTVLLAANLLPMLSFGFAIGRQGGLGPQAAVDIVALLIVVGNFFAAQLFVLYGRSAQLAAMAVSDVLLTLGLAIGAPAIGWPALVLAVASTAIGVFGPYGARSGRSRTRHPVPNWSSSIWLFPSLQIQWKALANRPGSMLLRLGAGIALALAADRLLAAFHFDGRSVPTAIVAMALIALVLSGTYRLLRDAHAPMHTFLATLPLPSSYWAVRDTTAVVLLGAPLFLLIISWLGVHSLAPAPTLFALLFAAFLLTAILRLPPALGGRLATLLGVVAASGWAGAAIAVVSR